MFDRVPHAQNGEGDVALFVEPVPAAPSGWRPEGSTGLWLTIPGVIDRTFALSAAALQSAVARGRLLVVEVGEGENRETWLPLDAA